MSFRFRRSVKLAPGLRLNFSGSSGVGLTAGPRGASLSFGRRGTYFNTGIPGTGFYSRTRTDATSKPQARSPSSETVLVKLAIAVDTDGNVTFKDSEGKPAIAYLVTKAKREHGDVIRHMLQETCEKQNAPAKALAGIHLETPPPTARVLFSPRQFEESAPKPTVDEKQGIFGSLLKSRAERIDAENEAARAKYKSDVAAWGGRKAAFEAEETKRKHFLDHLVFTDFAAMEQHLEQALQDIEWPCETNVSFEISDGGTAVALDVDLPEAEDMPKRTWSLPASGYRPTVKPVSERQLLKMYAAHVNGVGFRIVGEAFAILPSVMTVTLSAYSQRADAATGVVVDEYLYSVRATRDTWSRINFGNLAALDVVEALERFELRREMTQAGRFKPINPLRASAG